jgi:hypothetical protein
MLRFNTSGTNSSGCPVALRIFFVLIVLACLLAAAPTHRARAQKHSRPREAAGVNQQLDENCTVSLLNRTVRVNPDGTWVLPNIPANFGQVKARATCVRDSVTTSGESDFFTIPANGSVNIPPIVLGASSKVPTSITVTPAPLTFTAAGQTVQLTVTAHYPDNSTKDVSAASAGTNYTTSNAAIASVGADGLVTAVASGTVIIQATNDGAAGIITANVTVAGNDSDGDQIPDEDELKLGLDPHNPVDAQEDFDRDDLTNLREFQLGTDIRKRDTDSDGLADGEEVNRYHTNPLLADTDGDQIPDGVEVQTGSDPLNPNSFDLSKALGSIEVTPGHFALIVNTIIGEASQQLKVTGHLIDGKTTINLTATSRGTNYASSNLSVANFGATDGLVFAGSDGSATINVTNSGFTAAAQVSVSSFAPTALSFVAIPGFANNVDVSGNFAYVAAGATGLQVVDVTDRRAPHIVGSLDTPGNANDVRVVGTRAYVADGSAGLRVIDITNPAAPVPLGALDTPGTANDVVVVGNRAYVADGASGLQIIDVSNPQSPVLLGTLDTPGTANGVDVTGSVAVVADTASLRTIDVSDPAAPAALGSVSTSGARDLTVEGNTVYLADYSGSLSVVDISAPNAPHILAATPQSLGGILTDVAKSREFVFGSDVVFVNGVPIINVANPAAPVVRARLDFPARDDNGTGIAVDNSYIYLTADRSLTENGSNGDSRLYIGQYLAVEDKAGVPPVVGITSPVAGATVVEGSTIPVNVQATDDVQVVSVDFTVNGAVVFTDSVAPYQFSVSVPTGVTGLTLGATAIDPGSNVGTAADVKLNVIPDPKTTVTGRVVDKNAQPVSGADVSVLGRTGQTAADGTFTINGVPTVNGNLVVKASATLNGVSLHGSSAPVAPVAGGTTDVGQIVVAASGIAIFVNETAGTASTLDLNPAAIRATATGLSDAIDVAVTPDGKTAVVTGFSPRKVYFVDLTTETPTVTGSVNTPMSAEDIVVTCPSACYALVADGGSATSIVSINIATKTIVSTLNLPVSAQGITVTRNGLVLVNAYNNVSTIRVISLSSTGVLTDTGTTVNGGGNGALNVTPSPNGKLALVANVDSGSVGVLQIADDGTVSLVKSVPSFSFVQSIAFTPDGLHAYALLLGGQVGVLNVDAANNVTDSGVRIPIGGTTPGFYGVDQIAVTADNKVLVRVVGAVVVIDAATNTVIGSVTVANDGSGGIAIIP